MLIMFWIGVMARLWELKLAEKNAVGFSPEATREHIKLNITKCTLLQSRAGQYEQKFISLNFLADLRYTVTYLGILYLD